MRHLALAAVAFISLAFPVLAQDADPRESFDVSRDLSALPEPVAQMRAQLIEAAQNADWDAIKSLIDAQATPPTVSFGDPEDPIAYLKQASVDEAGYQILGVLGELLDAPYGVMTSDGQEPIYIWPYLAGMWDVTNLTPTETVDAYRLVSPEVVSELGDMGSWFYWRVLIGSDGEWLAFVAGD